ncbi:MAG: HEAT repeat domain-containing protein [Planctomycetota bacterium]
MTLLLGLSVSLCACLSGLRGGSRGKGGDAAHREVPPPAGWVEEVEFPPGLERPAPQREADIVAAVEDLISEDFGERTHGSRALLAYGEASIPYLGNRVAAAEHGPDPDCPHCIIVNAIVAKLPANRVGLHLDSPYAIVRIAAAESAGERGLDEFAPKLAQRLDDPELEVRRASVTALRRITRKFLGYRASDPASKRAGAAEAWRRETGAVPR